MKSINLIRRIIIIVGLISVIVLSGCIEQNGNDDKEPTIVYFEPILVKLEVPQAINFEEYCWSEELDYEEDYIKEGWFMFGNLRECYRDYKIIIMCPEIYDIYVPETRRCFTELNYTTGREIGYCCRIRTVEIPINRTIYFKNNTVSFEQFTEWFHPYYDNYEPYYLEQDLKSMFEHYGRL